MGSLGTKIKQEGGGEDNGWPPQRKKRTTGKGGEKRGDARKGIKESENICCHKPMYCILREIKKRPSHKKQHFYCVITNYKKIKEKEKKEGFLFNKL